MADDDIAADPGPGHDAASPDGSSEAVDPPETDEPDGTGGSDDDDGSVRSDAPRSARRADPADATRDGEADAAVARPGRWAAVGGVLTLAYLLWYLADLVLLDRSPRTYVTMHELYGSLFMRVVFAIVFLGLVFHGLDGVRSTIVDLVPRLGRRELVLRTAVRFLTFAVWIPSAFVLVWPAIRSRFAR